MNELPIAVPYCGLAPLPAEMWSRWNLDPVLLLILTALFVWHALRSSAFRAPSSDSKVCFFGGWAALAVGLISPLCALGVALFSVRVTQHMWLIAVAAPLLVLASRSSVPPVAMRRKSSRPFAAAGVFALALWIWHWPMLYALTFTNDVVYWAMHITMTGSAILLWHALLDGSSENVLARVSAGFVTLTQMGLLGALITFAPATLYAPHLLTAPPWGLTALEDQQLGGLIMWIPTGAVFLVAALASVYSVLRTQEQNQSASADV